MTEQWNQFVGDLHIAGDGTFLIRDANSTAIVKAAEADRSRAEPHETPDGIWTWTVDLPADGQFDEIEMDEQGWLALFANPARWSEPPSVHNSWCAHCPSVGISHGVCC